VGYSLTGAERRVGNGAAVSGGGGMVRTWADKSLWLGNKREVVEYTLIMSQIFVIKPVFFRLNQLFRIWGIKIIKKTY
jgi:hypothetical protein